MGKYLLNKETQKIELHFTKAEYLALPESAKKEIKSAFLFAKTVWVSRSIHYHGDAVRIAQKLELEDAGAIGERLSYAEELERKAERAEARAERYETYSENAEKRAENLQADFNKYRKDWSWLTQPIIAGHSGSRAFANHRNRVMARYNRGFEEYQKSEYYQDRAATARATADNTKLQNPVYLHNRVKECNANLKKYQEYIGKYEDALYKVQQGEELKNRSGELLTEELLESRITDLLKKYDWEYDKKEFFESHLENAGGNKFLKDNIKVGYIVNMLRWGKCEIVSTGPVNVSFKILTGGAAGGFLTEPYAAIREIVEVKQIESKAPKIENPYKVGDVLCYFNIGGDNVIRAYQIVKTTETGVKIQQIAVKNNIPVANEFISEKPIQKKVVKSKFRDFIGVYDGDWQLHKYTVITA